MKIDKSQPSHWLWLLLFFVQALLGLLLRSVRLRRGPPIVILYGHKLNGNLLALHHSMGGEGDGTTFRPIFLTMDRAYRAELEALGVEARWACGWAGAQLLGQAAAMVSDHGLHALQPMRRAYQRSGMHFFDVGHGIPFKGFDADDYRAQHGYDETWVASDLCLDLHVGKFGFDPARVVATGYPRTDRLVELGEPDCQLRDSLGLPSDGKLILFAPTWAQDDQGRSIYPFETSEASFLAALSRLAVRHHATLLLRTHPNTPVSAGNMPPGIVHLPGSRYPDTEAILRASDVLVCDWSSIAFDFLLLDRPTVFVDVKPPFRKGFSLGPEYRFGEVVGSLQGLLDALERILVSPDAYWRLHGTCHLDTKRKVYGAWADGNASRRCLDRLRCALG